MTLCRICRRQARGFGYRDSRFSWSDPRRYPADWVFCGRHCQNTFDRLYTAWRHAGLEENVMIDSTPAEQRALRRCLRPLGSIAGEIGFDKPVADYSEADALRLIEAVVSHYYEAIAAEQDAEQRGAFEQTDIMYPEQGHG